MKIFAMCPIYDDVRWLRHTVEGAYSQVDKIFLFTSDHPWHGAPRRQGSVMKAMRAISQLSDPDGKIEIVHDIWPKEETTRNEAMRMFKADGADYCMFLDSDEVWDPKDLERIKGFMSKSPEVQYWFTHWHIYWKDRLTRIEHNGAPLVFVKLDGVTKIDILRSPWGGNQKTIDYSVGVMHHMAYVRTDEEMRSKVRSIEAAHGIPADWFDRVWKGWDQNNDLANLHPVQPFAFPRTVPISMDQLPESLQVDSSLLDLTLAEDRRA